MWKKWLAIHSTPCSIFRCVRNGPLLRSFVMHYKVIVTVVLLFLMHVLQLGFILVGVVHFCYISVCGRMQWQTFEQSELKRQGTEVIKNVNGVSPLLWEVYSYCNCTICTRFCSGLYKIGIVSAMCDSVRSLVPIYKISVSPHWLQCE